MPRTSQPPKPIASIIIPTFNEEKNIGNCLASLSSQSIPRRDYEIIVSNGCSKDKTVAVAKKFADKIVFEKKPTIAAGRQKGAGAAKGRILVFTDADARPEKNWLEEILKPFEDSEVVCVHGALLPAENDWLNNLLCRLLLSPYFFLTSLLGLPSGAGSNLAVRAKTFEKAGGFDTDLAVGEDVELQKRVKRFGRIVFVPKAIVRVSFRRVKKWGYPRFIAFHALNFFKTHFFGRPAGEYERVR